MRIAITGIGMVSAIGCNCTETLQALRNERSGIGAMHMLQSVHTDLPVGEVPYTDAELKTMLGVDEPMPRTSLLGLMAAREALEMAGVNPFTFHLSPFIFISGTTVGGMDLTEQHSRTTSKVLPRRIFICMKPVNRRTLLSVTFHLSLLTFHLSSQRLPPPVRRRSMRSC